MLNVFSRRGRARSAGQTADDQFAAVLGRLDPTLVLDIGANVGQTAGRLRHAGFRGRIVSFEPVTEAYEALIAAAADDPEWYVASRSAVGAAVGVVEIRIAAASEMSSGLEPSPVLLELQPECRTLKIRRVAQTTVAAAVGAFAQAGDRVMLTVDVRGMEDLVLDGVGAAWPQIRAVALKLPLLPLYRDEKSVGHYIERLRSLGFEPWLLGDAEFAPTLVRQLRVDGLFACTG